MTERRIKISEKATIKEMLRFIHQSNQLNMPVASIEIVPNKEGRDTVYLIVKVADQDNAKLSDFIRGKIYHQVMKSFKCVK